METWELQPKNAAIRARLLLTKVPNWERVDKKRPLYKKNFFRVSAGLVVLSAVTIGKRTYRSPPLSVRS